MTSPDCDRTREVAAEIALGVAAGEDRAEALAHLRECAECRRELEELSRAADSLLELAPVEEPPVGFESEVLGRLERSGFERARAPRRWRRLVALAAAAAVGASATFGGVWLATSSQRESAGFYERALASAEGSYFGALPLQGPEGTPVGNLFGYEGEPPWLFVVAPEIPPGSYRVALVTREDDRLSLGGFSATSEGGSFGTTLPVPLFAMQRVVLLDDDGTVIARAVAPPSD